MAGPRWTSARTASAPVAPTTARPAAPAEVSATCRPDDPPAGDDAVADCVLCHGTGVMEWTQMCPDGVLRAAEHPCIRDGHAPGWHRSVDADDRVVDAVED
jgi:hypothetical protein